MKTHEPCSWIRRWWLQPRPAFHSTSHFLSTGPCPSTGIRFLSRGGHLPDHTHLSQLRGEVKEHITPGLLSPRCRRQSNHEKAPGEPKSRTFYQVPDQQAHTDVALKVLSAEQRCEGHTRQPLGLAWPPQLLLLLFLSQGSCLTAVTGQFGR